MFSPLLKVIESLLWYIMEINTVISEKIVWYLRFTLTMRMDLVLSSEMLVKIYKTTWHHNLEAHNCCKKFNVKGLEAAGKES
jgi:hypothetical protein